MSPKELPKTIDRYEVTGMLGRGGMGVVYSARDPRIGRQVAIKLLNIREEGVFERFLQEARAAGQLRHNNIITIYDSGVIEEEGPLQGLPFIVMEFVEGTTLEKMIREKAELPLDRKLKIVQEVCDGLAYAHDRGIVHRDIKPANIMIDPEGVVKILDFGVARVAGGEGGLTQTGSLMGTFHYMSPEQILGRPIDKRSDIFAVGLVFYELLALQKGFPGTLTQVLYNIVNLEPPSLAELCPDLDPTIVEMVGHAVQKNHEQRYQTLTDLGKDIAEIREGLEPSATQGTIHSGQDPSSGRVGSGSQRVPSGLRVPSGAVKVPSGITKVSTVTGKTEGLQEGQRPRWLQTALVITLSFAATVVAVVLLSAFFVYLRGSRTGTTASVTSSSTTSVPSSVSSVSTTVPPTTTTGKPTTTVAAPRGGGRGRGEPQVITPPVPEPTTLTTSVPTTISSTSSSTTSPTTSIRPTTTTTSVPAVDDRMVNRMLQAYSEAMRRLDPAPLRGVYPTTPSELVNRIAKLKDGFIECTVTFSNVRPTLNSATEVTVRAISLEDCRPRRGSRPTPQTRAMVFQLVQSSGNWIIEELSGW